MLCLCEINACRTYPAIDSAHKNLTKSFNSSDYILNLEYIHIYLLNSSFNYKSMNTGRFVGLRRPSNPQPELTTLQWSSEGRRSLNSAGGRSTNYTIDTKFLVASNNYNIT